MTEAIFLLDDRTTDTAQVLSCDRTEDGLWAVSLDRTIFHPQGGGQPSDRGTVGIVELKKALHTPDGIVHLLVAPVQGTVELSVDSDLRKLHSRLHSAGHIIGLVGDRLGWHATGGNHFPGESRVVFKPDSLDTIALMDPCEFESEVNCLISLNLDRVISINDGFRTVTWGRWQAYPCGGTHVVNTSEIGRVRITKIKTKKGQITVSYEVD